MTAAWWRRKRGERGAGGRGPSEPPGPSPNLLRKHPELVELTIESVARSQQLTQPETDELRSFVRRRLGDDDFAATLGYDDDAPVITQVLLIVDRLTIEHRDELWKRWRRQAVTNGHGRSAIALERLLYEEALPFEEAVDSLCREGDPPPSRTTLERLRATMPWRRRRPTLDLKWLAVDDQAGNSDADRSGGAEPTRRHNEVERVLSAVLGELPGEDRLLLRLRFAYQLPVEALARLRLQSARKVSRRITRLLSQVRRALRGRGVQVPDVGALLTDPRPRSWDISAGKGEFDSA